MNIRQLIKYYILGAISPIQRFLQKLGRAEPKMDRGAVDLAMSLVQEGDILLSFERQRITSLFIKGKYKHAAMLAANGKIVEAVGDKFVENNGVMTNIGGVREIDLEEWLFLMDAVAIVRPCLDKEVRHLASANALSYLGKNYDYQFRTGDSKHIYCSELPLLCYRKEIKFLSDYEQKEILPHDYRELCDDVNFKLIYEFI